VKCYSTGRRTFRFSIGKRRPHIANAYCARVPESLTAADDQALIPGPRISKRPRSPKAHSAARWVAYTAASWLILRPVLLTTVYADDYVNPFAQFATTRLNPIEMVRFAWRGAKGGGHINVLGQMIGTVVGAIWMVLMSAVGLRYSTVYAGTKLLTYLLTAVAAAAFVRKCSEVVGRSVSPWRARIYVSIALFTTLQIHIPWSNDPVSSYPASGFAATALGFLVLSLAIDALRGPSLRRAVICGVVGGLAVIYYEITLAAVAAIVPLAVWAWMSRRKATPKALLETAKLTAPMLVIPVVIALATKLALGHAASNYSGTEVALGGNQVRSVGYGIISTLPGSSWKVARDFLEAPIAVRATPVAILSVLAVALVLLAKRYPSAPPSTPVSSRLALAFLVASPLAFLLAATVIQTSTQKVQDEAPRIGYVYNYYAIGATAVAVIIALLLLAVPARWWTDLARTVAITGGVAFVSVQFLLNWNITTKFNDLTYPSRQLLVTFTERPPEIIRCSALQGWTLGPWPVQYETSMIAGLQDAYQYFHGEQFCAGFVRPD
jgi:hypothetical protein